MVNLFDKSGVPLADDSFAILILSPLFALFFKLTLDMYIALLLTLLLSTPFLVFSVQLAWR